MSDVDPQDAVQLLRTMEQHVNAVQAGLQRIAHELERRGLVHDQSKFSPDEFAAFCRINRTARKHPYGSEKYRAGLRQEKPTIDLHYKQNSHHPEHHGSNGMPWLDIVEMVCDWRAAYLAYGSQGSWTENLARQRERYVDSGSLNENQWWLVEQVAAFLVPPT